MPTTAQPASTKLRATCLPTNPFTPVIAARRLAVRGLGLTAKDLYVMLHHQADETGKVDGPAPTE